MNAEESAGTRSVCHTGRITHAQSLLQAPAASRYQIALARGRIPERLVIDLEDRECRESEGVLPPSSYVAPTASQHKKEINKRTDMLAPSQSVNAPEATSL